MNLYALIGLCFLPVIFLLTFLIVFTKNVKFYYYLISVGLGILAVIPASFIQYFAFKIPIFASANFVSVLLSSLLLNGLVEESVKLGFECFIPRKNLSFPAFFCCLLLLGLTVGSFESIVYTLNKVRIAAIPVNPDSAVKFILKRMISAQLIHTFCSALSGMFLWTLRKRPVKILPMIFAVVIHGLYNFFITFGHFFVWFSIAAIVFAVIETRLICKEIIISEEQNG